jgi:CHAT domain-containing protein
MKLLIPGVQATGHAPVERSLAEFVEVTVALETYVSPASRAAFETQFAEIDAAPDDVLEMQYENGVTQWVSVEQLAEDLSQTMGVRAAVEPGLLRIPLTPAFTQRSRGVLGWVLKGLRLLKVDPAKKLASLAAQQIIERFESKLDPPAGLYRLADPSAATEQVTAPEALGGTKPALILLHGTASSLGGSFGGLAGTPEWKLIEGQYAGRTFGFQHPTLSRSPVENAIELVSLLPENARLHIVSHSRGGLVGELLCLNSLAAGDLAPFREAGRSKDADQLAELSDLLGRKNLNIERFVRVACPARGTILASGRLDRYLSIILNVIGLIPALKVSGLYSFVKATLLELVKRRTEPSQVPGIEAQMPESPLIHLLNRPDIQSKADLAVIAGDIQGRGVWGHLKTFATDLFYREDHDLVVNTAAMYGGMDREKGAFFFFDKGPQVNHFNYFHNGNSRARVASWLLQLPGQNSDSAFKPLTRDPLADEPLTRASLPRSRAAENLPVLFLLPGIMGSHLGDHKGRVWLAPFAMAMGGLRRLVISADKIVPDGLISLAYRRCATFLQGSHDVIPFDYDWRLSLMKEGERLARAVKIELAKHDRPIRFLAHSMGGLVVRSMIAQDGDTWSKVRERGGRLIMLGTPNRGSFVIPRLLFRVHPTLRQLALLDFRSSTADLANIISRYPGVLEMLPENSEPDFFDHTWWTTRKEATHPVGAELRNAKSFRDKIAGVNDPERMIYVAGIARGTPSAIRYDRKGRVEWLQTRLGDGTVPYALGLLDRVPTYYMNAGHGNLADYRPAFEALAELLETGVTRKLATQPPARARGVEEEEPIRDDEPLLYPTEEELLASALGAERFVPEISAAFPIQLSVAHGHLRQASHPLAIGHYEQDTLVRAEKELDRQLRGRLSQRFHMDLYPERAGSAEVVLAPDCSPPGALLIGLGEVGSITPATVRSGVREAALKYALALSEEPCDPARKTWRSAAFSTLLVGTSGGNALTVSDSVYAIVQGALDANRILDGQGLLDRVRIDAIEFIELYENVAVEAVRAARDLSRRLPEGDIAIPNALRMLEGGLQQQPANPYASARWRRILVSGIDAEGKPRGDLEFVVLTDRARAEATLSSTQRDLIDHLIEMAIRSTSNRDSDSAALYDLLLPVSLKERAADGGQNLVVVVDRETARYPWELLGRRTGEDIQPIALQSGLIRQFRTTSFKPHPRQPRAKQALVLGDTQSGFMELPGAQQEAMRVADLLARQGYAVNKQIQPNAVTFVTSLFARDYQILHFAAHGEYNAADPKKSGVVLGGGIFLSAAEIQKLPLAPELVFINCCHLGQIDRQPVLKVRSPHRLAASIAEELINMGVKAVIAAGWAVDDAAADTFAAEFYASMLSGHSFGAAIRHARQRTYEQHPFTNTWGAYQAYGNPDFQLSGFQEGDQSSSEQPPECFSRGEYLTRFRSVSSQAKGGAGNREEADRLQKELEAATFALPPQWHDGEVLSALGDAWAELGEVPRAIHAYRAAVQKNDALVPVRSIEQLANLLIRQGAALAKGPADSSRTPPDPAPLFQEAIQWLDVLIKIGRSIERLSLLGGAHKRLALAASNARDRISRITEARDAYGEAHQLALSTSGLVDPYPALNWLTCRFLLGKEKKEALLADLSAVREAAELRAKLDPTFWNRVAAPDALLLEHLISGSLSNSVGPVEKAYGQTFTGAATTREAASVREHIEFLLGVMDKSGSKQRPADRKTLEILRSKLTGPDDFSS